MAEANSAIQEIGEQTTQAVGENRQELSATLDQIQRNEDLSEQAKSRLAEAARRKASECHGALVEEHERATKEVLESNERRLFRLSYPEGVSTLSERQAFRASYRDASFKVLNLPEDDLSRIMTRASRVGDGALEQACYHEAIERGLFGVAGEYRAKHPDAAEAWSTYERTRLSEEAHGATLTRALLATSTPGA